MNLPAISNIQKCFFSQVLDSEVAIYTSLTMYYFLLNIFYLNALYPFL
jgi:hypothetical protein